MHSEKKTGQKKKKWRIGERKWKERVGVGSTFFARLSPIFVFPFMVLRDESSTLAHSVVPSAHAHFRSFALSPSIISTQFSPASLSLVSPLFLFSVCVFTYENSLRAQHFFMSTSGKPPHPLTTLSRLPVSFFFLFSFNADFLSNRSVLFFALAPT